MFVFVAAGILGAAGLLGLGFGIPIKDTTFGNASLLSGVVLLSTSLMLVGLSLVVRELKAVARALTQGGAFTPQSGRSPTYCGSGTPSPFQSNVPCRGEGVPASVVNGRTSSGACPRSRTHENPPACDGSGKLRPIRKREHVDPRGRHSTRK